MHLHDRDLARSLIQFVYSPRVKTVEEYRYECALTTSFHYQSFVSEHEAATFFIDRIPLVEGPDINRIKAACNAKKPLQYLAGLTAIHYGREMHLLPINRDASASAFQIMYEFLLDKELGIHTNLMLDDDDSGHIKDIYSHMLSRLKESLPST